MNTRMHSVGMYLGLIEDPERSPTVDERRRWGRRLTGVLLVLVVVRIVLQELSWEVPALVVGIALIVVFVLYIENVVTILRARSRVRTRG